MSLFDRNDYGDRPKLLSPLDLMKMLEQRQKDNIFSGPEFEKILDKHRMLMNGLLTTMSLDFIEFGLKKKPKEMDYGTIFMAAYSVCRSMGDFIRLTETLAIVVDLAIRGAKKKGFLSEGDASKDK